MRKDKNINHQVRYMIINELVKLMEDINMKEIPENENAKKYSQFC